jgi:hypothetical protein
MESKRKTCQFCNNSYVDLRSHQKKAKFCLKIQRAETNVSTPGKDVRAETSVRGETSVSTPGKDVRGEASVTAETNVSTPGKDVRGEASVSTPGKDVRGETNVSTPGKDVRGEASVSTPGNQKIEEYEKRIEEYEKRIDEYEKRIDEYEKRIEEYEKKLGRRKTPEKTPKLVPLTEERLEKYASHFTIQDLLEGADGHLNYCFKHVFPQDPYLELTSTKKKVIFLTRSGNNSMDGPALARDIVSSLKDKSITLASKRLPKLLTKRDEIMRSSLNDSLEDVVTELEEINADISRLTQIRECYEDNFDDDYYRLLSSKIVKELARTKDIEK